MNTLSTATVDFFLKLGLDLDLILELEEYLEEGSLSLNQFIERSEYYHGNQAVPKV